MALKKIKARNQNYHIDFNFIMRGNGWFCRNNSNKQKIKFLRMSLYDFIIKLQGSSMPKNKKEVY